MLNDKTTWKHIVKKLLYVILGCLNSSLEPTRGVRLATTSQGNIVSRSYEDLEDCVYHLTATNAPSAIYFNDEDKTCQLSNGCSNDCFLETTNNDNDKVVIQHCHGYSVGTLTTTTSNQTSTTRTMTAAPKLTSSIRTTKAISTQIFFTEKPKLFIIPCKCYIFKEWASLTEHEIIKLLIKNLTIDTSNTTLALSKRISRSDPRASSAAIGRVASTICLALLSLIVLSDCSRLCRYIRTLKKNKVFPERRVTNNQYDINRLPHIYTWSINIKQT